LDEGNLAVGRTADICIFDPEEEWTLTPESSHSRGKNTPFMEHPLKGRVTNTLHQGHIVYSAT
jgi:dihydroorotase